MTLGIPQAVPLAKDEPCALCGSKEPRQLSHLIPKFVFQHASQRSPSGYLRTNIAPNRRSQDGPKEYLLCRTCEQRFSKWEGSFAQLFKAQYANPGQTFDYTSSDALCALSIVWRVLANARLHPELFHLTLGEDYSRTDEAFRTWSKVLLGELANPGPYRLNWIWWDYVTSGPKDINRYLFHASDYDLYASGRHSYAVAHIPGLFVIGASEFAPRNHFRGFDVSFQGGRYFGHGKSHAPSWLQGYIEDKMSIRAAAIADLSPVQKAKIEQVVLADPAKALRSPLFRSVLHDMRSDEK